MEYFSSYEALFDYIPGNPLIGIVVLLFFALLIYKKPKSFFSILAGVLFIAVVFYFIFSLSDIGSANKQKMIDKSDIRQEKYLLLIY